MPNKDTSTFSILQVSSKLFFETLRNLQLNGIFATLLLKTSQKNKKMTKMTNTKKRAIKIAAKRAAANQPRYRSASLYPVAYDEAMRVIDAINQRRGLGESPTGVFKRLTRVKGLSALLRAGASLGVDVIDEQAETLENE